MIIFGTYFCHDSDGKMGGNGTPSVEGSCAHILPSTVSRYLFYFSSGPTNCACLWMFVVHDKGCSKEACMVAAWISSALLQY